jgi:hypothetical protein
MKPRGATSAGAGPARASRWVLIGLCAVLVCCVVGSAQAETPSPSLVGVWTLSAYCGATVCNSAVWTISIGGAAQEKIDPDCSAKVYCMTTPNTSGPGNFYGEGVSLTPNGAGSWTETCVGCTGSGTFAGVFKGNTFVGTVTIPGYPVSKVTMTGGSAPAGASLSVAVSLGKGSVVVGSKINATVTVSAGGEDLTDVSLGKGLVSSSDAAVVSPAGSSGFDLAAGASRSIPFKVKGVKAGSVKLRVDASGTGSSGDVHAAGEATVKVADGVLSVVDVTRGEAALSAEVRVKFEDSSTDASGCDPKATYDFTDPQLSSAKKVSPCLYALTFDAPGTGIYHIDLKATDSAGAVTPLSVDQYGATVEGQFNLIIDSCSKPEDDLADVDALLDADNGVCAVAVGEWDSDAADVAAKVLTAVESTSTPGIDPVSVDSVDPSDWPGSRGLVIQGKAGGKGLVLKNKDTGWIPVGTKEPPEINPGVGDLSTATGGAAVLVQEVHLPPLPHYWGGADCPSTTPNLNDRPPNFVISSHGLWYTGNGLIRVPAGDEVTTYVPMGTKMNSLCLGLDVDTGHVHGDDTKYLHVYTAGQLMPNFTFIHYDDEATQGKHVFNTDKPITLAAVLRPHQGKVSIGTCEQLFIPAGASLAEALSSVPIHTVGTGGGGAVAFSRVTITQDGQIQTSAASVSP